MPIFRHLEALTSGTRIAIPSVDAAFASTALYWKGRSSMLSDNSKSMDNSGVTIVLGKDNATASLYGQIDIDSSPAIRGRLLALFEAPHPRTVSIDLSAVTHIDSSGIATLIEALRIARIHGNELRLEGLQDRLLRLFEFIGVSSLFVGSTRA